MAYQYMPIMINEIFIELEHHLLNERRAFFKPLSL